MSMRRLPAISTAATAAATTTTSAASTATASSTAATESAATATATTASAVTARFHRSSNVHCNRTSTNLGTIQFLNCCLGFRVVWHFDKAESLGPAGVTVCNQLCAGHLTQRNKHLMQLILRDVKRKSSNEQLSH